jgi:uroporphyrinogen-III synthase
MYLAGADTRADIPTLLGEQGIHVRPLIAYDAIAETQLPAALIAELQAGRINGVAFFSARSASIAHELLAHHGLLDDTAALTTYCLSANVAESACGLNAKRLLTCDRPNADAMRDLIVSLVGKTMV